MFLWLLNELCRDRQPDCRQRRPFPFYMKFKQPHFSMKRPLPIADLEAMKAVQERHRFILISLPSFHIHSFHRPICYEVLNHGPTIFDLGARQI